jgi:hypothetical protein
LSYQNSPKRNRFCLHRFKEGSQFTDLICSQMKLVSELIAAICSVEKF